MPLSRILFIALLAAASEFAAASEEERNIDPWEPFNRKIFDFNESLDRHILRPIARAYRAVTPDPVERSVSNFIDNVYEFNIIINSLLQGRGEDAFQTTGRFIINSTFGVLGLFDVATPMGVEKRPADFGQTLAVWGFDQGPFLMVPVFGPNTVRSGAGYLFDTYTSIPALQDREWAAYTFWAAEAIDIRAELIKADQLISGDKYIFVRQAFLQRREWFISGGKVDDEFSDFEDEDEYEDF